MSSAKSWFGTASVVFRSRRATQVVFADAFRSRVASPTRLCSPRCRNERLLSPQRWPRRRNSPVAPPSPPACHVSFRTEGAPPTAASERTVPSRSCAADLCVSQNEVFVRRPRRRGQPTQTPVLNHLTIKVSSPSPPPGSATSLHRNETLSHVRVLTADQNPDLQVDELTAAGTSPPRSACPARGANAARPAHCRTGCSPWPIPNVAAYRGWRCENCTRR